MDRLAALLDTSRVAAARGIFRIVAETMAAAARTHATDRGVDYRGLPLLAFGGAGPVHACAVGELLQSAAVIFPPQASVLSAFGTLVTPIRLDLVRSAVGRLAALNWNDVDGVLGGMIAEGMAALSRHAAWRRDAAVRSRPTLFRPAERGPFIPGPAIIEERETTIVIHPGWHAELGEAGCIIAKPTEV